MKKNLSLEEIETILQEDVTEYDNFEITEKNCMVTNEISQNIINDIERIAKGYGFDEHSLEFIDKQAKEQAEFHNQNETRLERCTRMD